MIIKDGGLHSSLGITAFVWNIIYSIGAFIREKYIFNIRTITAFCLPILLLVICICALPCIRHHFHNSYHQYNLLNVIYDPKKRDCFTILSRTIEHKNTGPTAKKPSSFSAIVSRELSADTDESLPTIHAFLDDNTNEQLSYKGTLHAHTQLRTFQTTIVIPCVSHPEFIRWYMFTYNISITFNAL